MSEHAIEKHGPSNIEIDWEANLRTALLWLSDKVPTFGPAMTKILELVWPEAKEDIWQTIQKQVSDMIDQKLLELQLKSYSDRLGQIQDDIAKMARWAKAGDSANDMGTEFISKMNDLLAKMDSMFSDIKRSDDTVRIHTIPIVVTFAHLHLRMMREKFNNGAEWLHLTGAQKLDFETKWSVEMLLQWEGYRDWFVDSYSKWKAWRLAKITMVDVPGDFRYRIHDEFCQREIYFVYDIFGEDKPAESDLSERSPYWEGSAKAIYERMQNDALMPMAKTMGLTSYLYSHLTDSQQMTRRGNFVKDLNTLHMGPYSSSTLNHTVVSFTLLEKAIKQLPFAPNLSDSPAQDQKLRIFTIWADAVLKGMQCTFSSRGPGEPPLVGNLAGTSGSGSITEQTEFGGVSSHYFTGMKLTVSKDNYKEGKTFGHCVFDGRLTSVQFAWNDAEPSAIYGKKLEDGDIEVDAVAGPMYRLTSCEYCSAIDKDGGTIGIKLIKLRYDFELEDLKKQP